MSLATSSGPSETSTRTASGMQRPAPATKVSSMCCWTVSSAPCTEAMPPCAHGVDPAATTSLVTTMTLPKSRHSSAAVSPAMPEPTTTTSTSLTQPGISAARRHGSSGSGGSAANVGRAPVRAGGEATSGAMRPMVPHPYISGKLQPLQRASCLRLGASSHTGRRRFQTLGPNVRFLRSAELPRSGGSGAPYGKAHRELSQPAGPLEVRQDLRLGHLEVHHARVPVAAGS